VADKALTIDLTNYKDRRGSRVEPGKYVVVVEDVESNKSNAGNPYLTMWLRVASEGEHKGDTILDRLVLTEKSLWRVVAFLQAVNVPTPRKRLSIPYRSIIGKRLTVDVEDGDPYNGTVRSRSGATPRPHRRRRRAAARTSTISRKTPRRRSLLPSPSRPKLLPKR